MPGNFISPEGDLERIFVTDYNIIDQFAQSGSLWIWGRGTAGALGTNSTTSRSSPVQTIAGGTNWKQVSTGWSRTGGIKTDGTLWMWGDYFHGGMGDNLFTGGSGRSSPVQTIASGTNWKQLSVGEWGAAAVKTDGTLWLWGYSNVGQLGNNDTTTDRSSPVQTVSGGTNWKQVSCGANNSSTAAVKTDGTLWLWGLGTSGQLGDNSVTNKSSPVQTVASGTTWEYVSSGGLLTAAVKTDGTLWLWGDNSNGQLGDNSTTAKSSPVQTVAGGSNWKQVAASYTHVAGIKTDGTLWLWGVNSQGNIGDNSSTSKSSPVQTVTGGTNWKQVDTGTNITAAIKTDGTLWTWGNGTNGSLGDNTIVLKSSPVQTVAGGNNWKQVSCETLGAVAAIHFYDAGNLYPSA